MRCKTVKGGKSLSIFKTVVTHVHFLTLLHLFVDLNPISLFGIISHASTPISSTAFVTINVADFTSMKLVGVYQTMTEHFRFVRDNVVDKLVTHHLIASTV